MKITENANMAEYVSFKAGGHAALLLEPEDFNELYDAVDKCSQSGMPFMIMGNGSNLLFTDNGYQGAVIKIGQAVGDIEVKDNVLDAGAGALLSVLANRAADQGLSGMEFACGIPGSLGGAIFMNGGAYEGEMSQIVKSVTCIDADGNISVFRNQDCEFGYRHSAFQDNGQIILKAKLELHPEAPEKIRARMAEFTKRRIEKQPLAYPSAGSFFKRPEGHFAGKLIEDAGLKGLTVGGAQVSELHAGFIINTGNATAQDIIDLMKVVQETVMDKFGVMLQPEVRIIGE